jgi:two-component system chemotaxis response regulator CheY
MIKLDQIVILVVDDDDEIRKLMIEYLTHFGFRNFLQSKNGTEAYRLLADETQQVDLIISDWEMPQTDGLTLLRAVRGHRVRQETPFIFVTSQQSNEREKIVFAKKYHVDAYIVKPFRSQTMREKVFQVLFAAEEKKKKPA